MPAHEKLMHWRPAQERSAPEKFCSSFVRLELITKEPQALPELLDLETCEHKRQARQQDVLLALKPLILHRVSLPGVKILKVPF